MDAETYPSDAVKEFLKPLVVMYLNPQSGGKEAAALGKQYNVDSFPRLVMVTPKGETLIEVKGGLTSPEQFIGGMVNGWWNKYVDAENAKPQDMKTIAENVFKIVTWFPHCEAGRKAEEARKRYENNAEFKPVWEELKKQHDLDMLNAKGDAQVKLGKKKEAIETYKAVADGYPGTKDAENALKVMKKLGWKPEAPPK